MKIEELGLSLRTYNRLKQKGYDTVEQIQNTSDEELLNIQGFGIGCLKEVREKTGRAADHLQKKNYARSGSVIVAGELEKAIKILNAEYEKAKKNSYIHNPVAFALYHTWKRVEENR